MADRPEVHSQRERESEEEWRRGRARKGEEEEEKAEEVFVVRSGEWTSVELFIWHFGCKRFFEGGERRVSRWRVSERAHTQRCSP
jgi:hypothetical protein